MSINSRKKKRVGEILLLLLTLLFSTGGISVAEHEQRESREDATQKDCAVSLKDELQRRDSVSQARVYAAFSRFTTDSLINRLEAFHVIQVQQGRGARGLETQKTFNLNWLLKREFSDLWEKVVDHFDPETVGYTVLSPRDWVRLWEKTFVDKQHGGTLAKNWDSGRPAGRERFIDRLINAVALRQQTRIGETGQPREWITEPHTDLSIAVMIDSRLVDPHFQRDYDTAHRRSRGLRTPPITYPLRGKTHLTGGDLETMVPMRPFRVSGQAPSRRQWERLRSREGRLRLMENAIRWWGSRELPLGALFLTTSSSSEVHIALEWTQGETIFGSLNEDPETFFSELQLRLADEFQLRRGDSGNWAQEFLVQGALTYQRALNARFCFQLEQPERIDYLNPETRLWKKSRFTVLNFQAAISAAENRLLSEK